MFDQVLTPSAFPKYAVTDADLHRPPAVPDVRKGRARLYRTVLRAGAKTGPNFAGHYTVIRIGCGAATTCVAIVDAKSGKVHFPTALVSVSALMVDTGEHDVSALNFDRRSRLLIVIGLPNERPNRAGVSYYVWQADHLRLIRFTPAASLCKIPASTRF